MQTKRNLEAAFTRAVMIGEPMIIVEGKDDYQIYQNLARQINPNIEVFQVNEFENYTEGCRGVIDCVEVLQTKFEEKPENIQFALGIIDRDVRPYRNELPDDLQGLFITKYYSFETYFATKENLRKLIAKITYATTQDIDNQMLEFVLSETQNPFSTLYLISLEALKNACVPGYTNLLGYDDSVGKIAAKDFHDNILPQLLIKKDELETFAATFNLTKSDLKQVAKGKWYLHWLLNASYPKISELKTQCTSGRITQCRSCRVGNYNDCLFKTKQKKYAIKVLENDMLTFVDEVECEDIMSAISVLRLN